MFLSLHNKCGNVFMGALESRSAELSCQWACRNVSLFCMHGYWNVPRHFDRSKNNNFSLFAHFPLYRVSISWVLVSAVTKLARSDQRFLRDSLGNFRGFGLQRYFRMQNLDVFKRKSPNQ